MLVISRKFNESLRVGDDIVITVVRISRRQVQIGIDAPRDVEIVRNELEDEGGDSELLHSRRQ